MIVPLPRSRRTSEDNVLPLINIVFLLLIFFLLTATVAPPDPLEVSPPESGGGTRAEQAGVLYLSADGRLAFEGARGEAVFDAITARGAEAPPLMIRADRAVPGDALARLLARLGRAGAGPVRLVVNRP